MCSCKILTHKFLLYLLASTFTIPLMFFWLFCLAPSALPQGSDHIGQVFVPSTRSTY